MRADKVLHNFFFSDLCWLLQYVFPESEIFVVSSCITEYAAYCLRYDLDLGIGDDVLINDLLAERRTIDIVRFVMLAKDYPNCSVLYKEISKYAPCFEKNNNIFVLYNLSDLVIDDQDYVMISVSGIER